MARRVAVMACLAVAAGVIGCSGADVSSAPTARPSAGATTTTDPSTHATLIERTTPLGDLLATRGPATQPWRFDPHGPTDRWREPARCYLPRLTVRIGERTATTGLVDSIAPLVLPVLLRSEPDGTTAVVAVVVFGATTGRTYRFDSPEEPDQAVADREVAVLVRRAEVDTTADASSWSEFAVVETAADGTERRLEFDLPAAENAFYAGDVNNCPDHTGVTPRPTVLPPADLPGATDTATRALDPATAQADALAGFDADPDLVDELTALSVRIAEQARAYGATEFRVVPDPRIDPVFHSADEGWVPLALFDGGMPAPFGFWAKVERTHRGWLVDPRSVCGAFDQLVLSGAPPSCSD